jgi:lambda repressor-like predicted transcriptional regulator
MTTYDVDYFIKKFSTIPDDKWCVGAFNNDAGCCCALGHCGHRAGLRTTEGIALGALFNGAALNIVAVNDRHSLLYTQDTPKARILAALHDIKKNLSEIKKEIHLTNKVMKDVSFQTKTHVKKPKVTPREKLKAAYEKKLAKAIKMFDKGMSIRAIAAELHISPNGLSAAIKARSANSQIAFFKHLIYKSLLT